MQTGGQQKGQTIHKVIVLEDTTNSFLVSKIFKGVQRQEILRSQI